MPARSRTSLAAIVAAAGAVLEAEGPDGLTMSAVADRVGVRPPSLYKHVADRDALARLVATGAAIELAQELQEVDREVGGMPGPSGQEEVKRARVRGMADAVRAFAHRRPQAFVLIFRPASEAWRVPAEDNARTVVPILAAAGALAGPDRALVAARALTSLVWGFVSMELAGSFRLGGDVDEAWAYAVDGLVDVLADSRGSDRMEP